MPYRTALRTVATAALLWFGAAGCHAGLIGPTPYLSSADSPFDPADYSYFHREDFEDGLSNAPGVTVTGPAGYCVTNTTGCFLGSTLVDSVDGDNGPIDGLGRSGHSLFGSSGATGFTFAFNAALLGVLPTDVAIVWTDGGAGTTVTLEAFDENGVSLGTISGTHADGNNAGGTAEDRLYGATHSGGISRIHIRHTGGGIEVDHLQYGALMSSQDLPEPGTLVLLGLGLAVGLHSRQSRSSSAPGAVCGKSVDSSA